MDQAYVQLLLYLAAPAILGIVGAIIKIWIDFTAYKLHVSENYVKRADLHEIKEDTKEMKSVIYQIAGKVGVPINR